MDDALVFVLAAALGITGLIVFVLAAALGITGLIVIVGAITEAQEKHEARQMRERHV